MNSCRVPLKLAIVGTGFWARFQVRAWRQLEREGLVQLVAICDQDRQATIRFVDELKGPATPFYADPEQLLQEVSGLSVVDIITTTTTHHSLTTRILAHGIPVIVQKPMAQTLSQAIEMVKMAQQSRISLLVHENFRWQKPFVILKQMIAENRDRLGEFVDVRIEYESGGEDYLRGQPYFSGQRFLVNGEVGVHLVDLLRFLTERNVLRITSAHMHAGVDHRFRGEDVAHVTLDMQDRISAAYRVAFSAARGDERPPQTFARIIFRNGTIELGADYELTMIVLDRNGRAGIAKEVTTVRAAPDGDEWTKEPYLGDYQSWLGQWECCLPTNRSCAEVILGQTGAEARATSGHDNLNVLATVFGAYLASMDDVRVDIPQSIEELEQFAGRLDDARIGYPDFPGAAPPPRESGRLVRNTGDGFTTIDSGNPFVPD
jgi:D-apiose dehydrogenase